MINKRLFGAPIRTEVQKELNKKKEIYLGEKLPFIRMWVAPKLVGMAEYTELLEQKSIVREFVTFTEEDVQNLAEKKYMKLAR